MPNQSNRQPDHSVARFLRDNILSSKHMLSESSKQQDNITVWLVGMSTGAIAIIISQFGKLSPDIYATLKWSVGFFTATITLGLFFRVSHLFFQDKEQLNIASTVAWLDRYLDPAIDLPKDASAGLIAMYLYDRLGLTMELDQLRDIEANNDVEYWRNEYKNHIALNYQLEQLKHNNALLVIEDFHAHVAKLEEIPLHKYKQRMQDNKSRGIKKPHLRYACTFFYSAMCISFAVSVLCISYGFIKTDLKANPPSASTNQRDLAPSKQLQPTSINKSN